MQGDLINFHSNSPYIVETDKDEKTSYDWMAECLAENEKELERMERSYNRFLIFATVLTCGLSLLVVIEFIYEIVRWCK